MKKIVLKAYYQFFVLPHGLTDLWDYSLSKVLLLYFLSTLLLFSFHKWHYHIFLAASVLHFAQDGANGVFVVPLLLLCEKFESADTALMVLAFYMTIVHLPTHYENGIPIEAWVAVLVAGACFLLVNLDPATIPVTSTALTLGHALTRLLLPRLK